MEMHESKKAALCRALLKGLEKVEVYADRIVMVNTLAALDEAEKVMGGHGENQRLLADAVDSEQPITEIVYGYLSPLLANNDFSDDKKFEPLSECSGVPTLDVLARDIADFVERMPLPYRVLFPLPDAFATGLKVGNAIELGPKMRLRMAGPEGFEEYPLTSGSEVIDRYYLGDPASNQPVKIDGLYLEVDESGFMHRGSSTSPRYRALDSLHTFLGMGMVLGLVRPSPAPMIPMNTDYFVFRVGCQELPSTRIVERAKLSDSAASLMGELRAPMVFFALDKASPQSAMTKMINNLRAVANDSADAHRIRNAAKWYFDARASRDPLLSFVQMMVVLEILYGDKELSDKIGLGELLRNRCAYAIGRAAEDRSNIIREFKEIYNIRSQIVHTGKSRLTAKERSLFHLLSDFCERAISHEVKLIYQDAVASGEIVVDAPRSFGLMSA